MPSSHLILCRPLLFLPLIFPASGSFPMSQLFTSGGQSIGASASASVVPMNTQDFSLLGWTVGSPRSPRDSQESSPNHSSETLILWCSAFFIFQISHPYMTTRKTIALNRQTAGEVMSLLFNMVSRLVITFLLRSKHLLISQLQLPSAVIWGPKKNKDSHCSHCFPIYLPGSDGT